MPAIDPLEMHNEFAEDISRLSPYQSKEVHCGQLASFKSQPDL
ncbi:hypothetical protein AGR6A_pa30026 [Agrobacterium sp. NCPPB 925]|nr:hypothetical protein AGR6A_pa30026 [Agrobacterium sp. NCPPB 925]